MADYGADYTDKAIIDLDHKLKDVYKEAQKDIEQKMDDFTAKYKAKEKNYTEKVAKGEMTQDELDKWKKGQVFQGEQWKAKKDEITNTLYNSNKIASDIVNKKQYPVFAANNNFASYQIEHDVGANFGFGLYDSNTVIRLIDEEPNLLPNYQPKKSKDVAWNSKKITRQITQGVIQGESLDRISKRLAIVTTSQNMNSMKTHARTLMTGAQNAGRLNSYKNAESLGIKLQKEWMATLDSHTRDSHAHLDGEKVDIDKKFSNGLMYPGDPDGAPAELYNCRCTMVSDVEKYPSSYNRYDNISGEQIKNMSYEDWENAKKNSLDLSPIPLTFKHYKTNEQQALMDLFKDKSMSGLYSDMKTFDKSQANLFYKTLGEEGKPSEVWNNYLNGELSEAEVKKIEKSLDKYINAQSTQMTIPKTPTQVLGAQKVKEIDSLEDAQAALKSAEKAIKTAGADKEFKGIWKDPVTYADYDAKKGSIAAKKKYYEDQITKYSGSAYDNSPWAKDEVIKLKEYLKDLEDFEKNGAAYSQLFKNVEEAKAKVKALSPVPAPLSKERKDAAIWAKSSREADDVLRARTGEVWQKATATERAAAYEYTGSYHKFNEPLRGYEYGSNVYKGVGKTDLNAGYQNNGNKLNAMTKLIDKCSYDHDMWLQRGVGFDGMDKFFDCDMSLLKTGSEKELQKELLGKPVTEYGFMSCGSSKGKGFSGDILLNIYAPSGTKMMYVEPFSAFGDGEGKKWDGKSSQSFFGSELETILQQGTQFNITKVEKKNSTIYVDLEVINQLPPQLYKK